MARGGDGDDRLIPHRRSERVSRFFSGYVARLMRRKFHAVRVERSSLDVLESFGASGTPGVVVQNHASWWDPLVPAMMWGRWMPNRAIVAPIDRAQLERFAFFRRIGLFGIDPDDPSSLEAMRAYVAEQFDELSARGSAPILWLTPQGRFTDVREPIRIRPGAAAIAAAQAPVEGLSIAIEYAFWQDQRAEIFLSARAVEPDGDSTAAWQRAFTATMQSNADRLAALVRARDPEPFEAVIGADAARINPVYDLWLRATGRAGEIPGRRAPRANDGAGTNR